MSWRPLLEGEDAERAREAVGDITADLGRASSGPRLDGGHAGQAILHTYLAKAGDPAAAERAVDHLAQALDGLGALESPWLLDGFSGVAWTAAHLGDLVDIDDDTADGLDQLVGRVVAADPWPFEWEYVAGLIGLGVYALERRSPAGEAMRTQIVAHLAARAERGPDGVTWRAAPRLLSPEEREQNPGGVHNLGLAHGVVGVIAFLAGAADAPGARELLAGAVRWLLPHDTGSAAGRFPYALDRGAERPGLRRDGWCYGDQAAAVALLRASRPLGEPRLRALAIDLAQSVVERSAPLETSFCHGTLGRAHMFNRLAQATGDERLADAARDWYRETLARRRPGTGIGGYRTEHGPESLTGFIVGATGIALGLLAAVAPVEPAWDRALLVDLPVAD
jgi:hypothetical protein